MKEGLNVFDNYSYEELTREFETYYKIVLRLGEALQKKMEERLRILREQPLKELDK